jgi:hypothetical protein
VIYKLQTKPDKLQERGTESRNVQDTLNRVINRLQKELEISERAKTFFEFTVFQKTGISDVRNAYTNFFPLEPSSAERFYLKLLPNELQLLGETSPLCFAEL